MYRPSSPTATGASPARTPARWPLAFAPLLLACAHAAPAARTPLETKTTPVIAVSDESYDAQRADYDALSDDDPTVRERRSALRDGLERYLLDELRHDADAGRLDEAWDDAQRAMTLRTAADLARPEPDPALADAATRLESAFARRGAYRQVLALLAVRVALRPDDQAAAARFDRVVEWLRGDEDVRCSSPGCDQAIEALQQLVAGWPAPFVVERLAALYWQRHRSGGDVTGVGGGTDGGGLAALLRTRSVTRTGLDLARLYLRVAHPEKALAALDQLVGQPGEEPKLREALRRYLAPDATVADALALAVQFIRNPRDRSLAEGICRATARRFPNAAEPALCVGELAIKREQLVVAIQAFQRAATLNPDDHDTWETLARLHQARLAQLVGDERTTELPDELRKVEAFHEAAHKRFPDAPLDTPLAGAYFEVGRGLYNAGRPDDAAKYLEQSIAAQPTPYAYEQLAQLRLKQGHATEAAATFRKAMELVDGTRATGERDYWRAKLERGLGDALDESGDGEGSVDARRSSLASWERLLARHLEGAELAEGQLERGKLLYALGERDPALAAFTAALDADPERGASYAGALAFLIPRGEHDEALAIYHRALGHGGVSEYLKVYCSLWLLDEERRLRLAEDPRARDFLDGVDGDKWYQQLARWATGRTSDDELGQRAHSDGERCELAFYRAMRHAGDGHPAQARALWQSVIDSQMMAFFEYDMAGYYLRHATTKPPATPPVAVP